MEELLESIRAAVASGATTEQKARGAHACRAILAALDTQPGKPLAVANAPAAHPLAGVPPGQMLDLLIAKLSATLPPEAPKGDAAPRSAPPERQGIRIAFVPAPSRPRRLGATAQRTQPATRKP